MVWRTNLRTREKFLLPSGIPGRVSVRLNAPYTYALNPRSNMQKPSKIAIGMEEKEMSLAFEHEVGHVVYYRFPMLAMEFDDEWTRNNFVGAFTDEHSGPGFDWKEIWAEMYAARSFGWERTRFAIDPEQAYPKMWAIIDRAWRTVNE